MNYQLSAGWKTEYIDDWKNTSIIIEGLPPYNKHGIRVLAENELGEANDTVHEIIQYSGEDILSNPPYNLKLVHKIDDQTVLIRWDPLKFNGRITKYTIRVQNQENPLVYVEFDTSATQSVTTYLLDSINHQVNNYVTVVAHSEKYTSQPSDKLLIPRSNNGQK